MLKQSLVAVLLSTAAFAASPETRPTTRPGVQLLRKVTPAQYDRSHANHAKVVINAQAWSKLVGDGTVFRDPDSRAAVRDQLIALDRAWVPMVDIELAYERLRAPIVLPIDSTETPINLAYRRMDRDPVLLAVGDDWAAAINDEETASSSPRIARIGRLKRLLADWLCAPDAAAERKILPAIVAEVKGADPTDALSAAVHVAACRGVTPAVTTELRAAMIDAAPAASHKNMVGLVAQLDRKDHGITEWTPFEGKPMVLAGTTVDGKPFTTADWKGKVVMVDFWATTCYPCKQELPHAVELYGKYHAQGLEVVQVSNDWKKPALTKYLADHPELAWTHLFDPVAAAAMQFHPLAVQYKIKAIPQVFLIDRDGVLYTAEARYQLDELIPKLLAKPASTATAN